MSSCQNVSLSHISLTGLSNSPNGLPLVLSVLRIVIYIIYNASVTENVGHWINWVITQDPLRMQFQLTNKYYCWMIQWKLQHVKGVHRQVVIYRLAVAGPKLKTRSGSSSSTNKRRHYRSLSWSCGQLIINKYDTVVGEVQQFSSNLMALGSV